MPDAYAPIRHALAEEAGRAVGTEVPEPPLAPPGDLGHGDLASPVAMALARTARRPPREIADAVAAGLRARPDAPGWLAGVEVAGPGFLNLSLTPAWFAGAVAGVVGEGDGFGAGQAAPAERILLEYVSANPTGPPHAGHARHAAYGDSLGRLLAFAGHEVTREFYVNDHGRQMRLFGASVAARYAELAGRPVPVPEDGYHGDYVRDIAARLRAELGDGAAAAVAAGDHEVLARITAQAEALMLEAIRADLTRFRARFDTFFSERTLHESGAVAAGVGALREAGDAYEDDGALWFRTSAYGDEKDRVLVRGDGEPTYLASDVAYHLEKAARGHDRLIDVLGADHHGYVGRLRAVLAAGGHAPERLEVPIVQLVSLMERGEAKRMSKRAGTLVTLAALLDDIGADAARFFMVQRSHETPLDLDLDLARERGQENPVYYVQYAHARIAGILRGAPDPPARDPGPPAQLDPSERALVLRVLEWPTAVREAEERRAVHRIAAYLLDLAREFHGFYTRCRVGGAERRLEAFRLDACRAAGAARRPGLDLLGVDAPQRM